MEKSIRSMPNFDFFTEILIYNLQYLTDFNIFISIGKNRQYLLIVYLERIISVKTY